MLERIELIFGIVGSLFGAASIIWVWRKGLLNSSFEHFRQTYRVEMDSFKDSIQAKMFDLMGYLNKHTEENKKNYERLVEVQVQILEQVKQQTTTCKVIQARREGSTKADDMWRNQIEEELNEVREDVKHIKKVLNHSDLQ